MMLPRYWLEFYNNPDIARDNEGFRGAEQLWIPSHRMRLRAREHYNQSEVTEGSDQLRAPAMDQRDMLFKHLGRQDVSFGDEIFSVTDEAKQDLKTKLGSVKDPSATSAAGSSNQPQYETPPKTRNVNLAREPPALQRSMEMGIKKLQGEIRKQLALMETAKAKWADQPAALRATDRAGLSFTRTYQFRHELVARLGGFESEIAHLVPDSARLPADGQSPPSPQSAITGMTAESIAKADDARRKVAFKDFLLEEETSERKFWDGELIELLSIDELRDLMNKVLDVKCADQFLQIKSSWQSAEKAIVTCCKGLKTSFDDLTKRLKAVLNDDKRSKRKAESEKEKDELKKLRQEAADKAAEIKRRKTESAPIPKLYQVDTQGLTEVRSLTQEDLPKLSADIRTEPWKVSKHEELLEALGESKLQKALASWGAQYKRTLAQVKVPCATYAMSADNGKEAISGLLSSLLGKNDIVDVSSVGGGAGFMSATWMYGCQSDMKILGHLPNFASMLKVQVSGDVRHMFIEIKSLLKLLCEEKVIKDACDLSAAQAHTLQLDRGGLNALIKKGLQVRVCALSKNELLYQPLGWMVMEVALPSVHIYGVRKSFFMRSNCQEYKLALEVVKSQGKPVDRMKQIVDLMSADPSQAEQAKNPNADPDANPTTPQKRVRRGDAVAAGSETKEKENPAE